jgi:hypothetical protein
MVMFDRVGEWAATLGLTGAVSLPAWAVVATAVVVVAALAFMRAGRDVGVAVVGTALVLIAVLTGWGALDQLARGDRAAEQRALDARTSELAKHALVPGSALACLDAIAGEMVEDACEKALFGTPEATAAAVSYVAAQLALLASASEQARKGGLGDRGRHLRRALEADRFGITAHVLATRDGCTPGHCSTFAWLQDTSRIRANLAERPFEARVKSHLANWAAAAGQAVASPPSASASPAPTAAARAPNNLYFPSSSSIPPVNIMTAEPSAQQQPSATTGTTGAATPRKPSQGAAQGRQPSSSGNAPARSAPTQLAPPP